MKNLREETDIFPGGFLFVRSESLIDFTPQVKCITCRDNVY